LWLHDDDGAEHIPQRVISLRLQHLLILFAIIPLQIALLLGEAAHLWTELLAGLAQRPIIGDYSQKHISPI
jgi:hypothetical protein